MFRRGAGRKMAGKKGQVVQLQLEVNTNEEWQKLLEKDGLIVVDIYSEWCGPCIGMTGTLKRIKLEIGGDFLTFAIAKSDDIDLLERFRNRSEPTWMFIAGGQMVNLMLGADAPRLTNLIIKEIEKEKKVLEGQCLRVPLPFNQLTPEEEVRFTEKERIRKVAREQEEAALATIKARQQRREIRNLTKYIGKYTVILIMPYLYEDGVCEAWLQLSEIIGEKGYSVEDEEKIQLEPELAKELIYGGMGEPSEEFVQKLQEGQVVAKLMLFKQPNASETEVEAAPEPPAEGAEEGSESDEEAGEAKTEETDALVEIEKLIYGHTAVIGQEGEMQPDEESFAGRFRLAPDLPGIWTPYTPSAKANAIMKLFPKFAAKFALPPPPELPPVMTMIFDASKSAEVSEIIAENEENVICMAYFSGPDPSTAKKIALTREQYDQRRKKKEDDKIVLIVNRKKSEPLLSFCQLGPSYISANTDDGKKDYEAFFPEEEEEEYIEPDEPEDMVSAIVEKPEDQVSATEEDATLYTYEKAQKYEEEYDTISDISGFPGIGETGSAPSEQPLPSGEQATAQEPPAPAASEPAQEPIPSAEPPPTPS